ncbi:Arrestin domain-containing protein 3 [Papilio xuthus]|uniref:Arrestin domain-containing protein 3 n=1 Tax=Papilio xuthus TaxID=66420 RepID=A0A194Q4M4_PAPXU|nr:Arrestin domain-containing protein 3 [Papilio xuthus]
MPRKLLKFLIVFDNTSLLYFPGQFLSGKVLMELQGDTPVLGLHFHVIGEGVVRVGSGRHERLFDKENYIDFRMRLLGESGHTPSILSPGIHSFPFKLGLPMGLPSTFLGTHGWVQYYCKAALREPNGLTHKNQQVFIVMNPIDLNLEPPVLSQELECSIEHRVGVGCVGGGAVACSVTLDRGAYVPGESIALSARLVNNSRTAIKCTRAALTETIQYSAHGKVAAKEVRELATLTHGKTRPGGSDVWRREQHDSSTTRAPLSNTIQYSAHGKVAAKEVRELATLTHSKTRPGGSDVWRRELLYVPPLPPTNLRGCHLIAVHYDVYFIIEPKSLEKEVKLQLPIVLGTYPFREREETGERGEQPPTHYPTTLPVFRAWLHDKPR